MTKEERDVAFPVGCYSNQWLEARQKQKDYWLENCSGVVDQNIKNLILGVPGLHTEDGLDPGVQPWVVYLMLNKIPTIQSCEGGPGHGLEKGFAHPYIQLEDRYLFEAYGLLQVARTPVRRLRYEWLVDERGFIYQGPTGFITFSRKADERDFYCLNGGRFAWMLNL